jgi:predicted ribosome quality control (RQC) complex YloA/Tae2 family protein
MDAVLLAGIAREWHEQLEGARVERAFSPDAHRIDIALRGGGREARLAFYLRPGEARCHPDPDSPPNPPVPSGFCMFLRRHLVGSRILGVAVLPAERHLVLKLRSENEIGVREERQLHFEAFGPRPNLVLVDGAGRVMDAFRRVSAAGEGARAILPGLSYGLPPPGAKADPFALGVDGLVGVLAQAAGVDRLGDLLVRRLRGLSPSWAREILALAGLDPDAAGRDIQGAEAGLRQAFERFLELLAGAVPAPCVAYDRDGRPLGPFPATPAQFGTSVALVPFPRLADAVAAYHGQHDRNLRVEQRRSALLKNLEKRRGRLGQKLARQDQEWREAERDLSLRHTGELLLANLHAVAAGARQVAVPDWDAIGEDGEAPEVRITLDPEKSASENAERLFARYHKARRRHDALDGEMGRARRELEYIDTIADALRRAEEVEVLEALAEEVETAGVLGPPPGAPQAARSRPRTAARGRTEKAPAGRRAGAQKAAAARPAMRPLVYRTVGGFLVQVGRTGVENDRLSLRVAAPDDLWFHVAHGPGAHAVLRLESGPPGEAPGEVDVAAAAMLAAYHSPARTSAHVEVDHCRAGRLRKAPGARPGLLLYDRERSFSVTPDAHAVEAMRRAAEAPQAAAGGA